MILFKPDHVTPILEGRKTQTRRLGNKRWNVGAIHECKTKLFGEGSEPFARVEILRVHMAALGAISEEDARAEGYDSIDEYLDAFRRINKVVVQKGSHALGVWVIEFQTVGDHPDHVCPNCDEVQCHGCFELQSRCTACGNSAPSLAVVE